MVIKKCSQCGKEEDFSEEPMCDKCAHEIYSALLIRELENSSLKLCELKKIIKKFNPDLIHAHDVRATLISTAVSNKIPVISHLHGNIEDMRRMSLKSILYMISTKRVRKVISVSESVLSDYIFKKKIENKTVCLRNIVYPERIKKLMEMDSEKYSFDFSYIGRLAYPKNPQRVAKVASEVLKRNPTLKFGVIGDGEFKEDMRQIFEEQGIIDRVNFTGILPYPYKALSQSRCMLMCSRFEGTPIAALESMSLGVPIISTPVDGMIKIVDDNKTGYLHNDDEKLVESVLNLLTDEKLQNEFSNESIKRFNYLNDVSSYKE